MFYFYLRGPKTFHTHELVHRPIFSRNVKKMPLITEQCAVADEHSYKCGDSVSQ